MQAVILCGGLGTRLREETEFRPKPMVWIGDRPILWHIMKMYAEAGITDFILVLGYKGEMIRDYFLRHEAYSNDITITLGRPEELQVHGKSSDEGWRITMVDTGQATLKGARLKRIEKYVDGDTFLMTYGDGVSNVSVPDLLDFHRNHGKIVTVTGVNPAARFGELKVEGDSVKGFFEKPDKGEEYINGGFFVFDRRIFDYLAPEENCDLEYGPLEELARKGEIMIHRHHGFWACMDTLRDVDYLNELWKKSAPWKIW